MELSACIVVLLSLFISDLQVGQISIETHLERHSFDVEIASSSLAHMRGLMHRQSLEPGAGMLFVYPHERSVQFWTKKVAFPLDMLFLNRCGVILSMRENVPAFDETIISLK